MWRARVALGLVATGCTTGQSAVVEPAIEALQFGETWVFAYEEEPNSSNDALLIGALAVRDGCLKVDRTIVVWWPTQLVEVEEAVEAVEEGATVSLRVGGSGLSLDEGATTDDIPEVVRDRCGSGVREVWFANGDPLETTKPPPYDR